MQIVEVTAGTSHKKIQGAYITVTQSVTISAATSTNKTLAKYYVQYMQVGIVQLASSIGNAAVYIDAAKDPVTGGRSELPWYNSTNTYYKTVKSLNDTKFSLNSTVQGSVGKQTNFSFAINLITRDQPQNVNMNAYTLIAARTLDSAATRLDATKQYYFVANGVTWQYADHTYQQDPKKDPKPLTYSIGDLISKNVDQWKAFM